MPDRPTVTLSDVAKKAGVSAATVSRTLRGSQHVSEKLQLRIRAAVEELGYIPDPVAQALAASRSNVIGVLIPSVTNNVFSATLQGIYEAADDTPYDIQLGNTRYSALKEEMLVRLFLRQRPAGLIISGIDQMPSTRALLERANCPVVQIMEISDDPIDMMIGFSHYEAAKAATQHLIEQGYRKLGFLGARMDPRTQRRLKGFRDAAMAAGVYSEARIRTTQMPSTVTLGSELFAELLGSAPDTDAIFCINDDIALGALFEAQRRRIEIPRQLGLCGFNDFEMMAVANPSITSVRTFRQEMGSQAMKMLVQALDDPTKLTERYVDLGFEIRVRESTSNH
ncbi:LacI family DNA-binding transcriptional regulator [Solirhodobacter olei]|uniref:LacI family DNA-binding transcriptional regulator n=1 Tax=Solirhodobacter olei TaxID=2493082 RepID=UPI000FDBD04B|nr:LacI family DNA-binding transcriptional regulator [Solirhodobacter olei]